jgi:predicted deacylase
MAEQSTGWTDIDLESDGKHSGWIFMPHSTNSNGWGCIRIPICCIKNGSGPTAFLMGGNHGDEYEGQVGLTKLYRETEAKDISGRIIILPSANYPACAAGERVSPVDDGNLNRSFPGKPHGTLTERIAHFINDVLFPLSDWHIDVHAGGKSDDFVPLIVAYLGNDDASNRSAVEGVKLLGMPYYVAQKVRPAEVSFASAGAVNQGVIAVGGEFGGGGGLSEFGLKIVDEGMPRLLRHIGVLSQSAMVIDSSINSQRLELLPTSQYPFASCSGIFESYVALGDHVRAGDVCGVIHGIDDPSTGPQAVTFQADGLVISLRRPRRVEPGVCLMALGIEVDD